MAEYRDLYERIRNAGADVAGVAVDPPERSEAVRQQLRLQFPILCDTQRQVVREWGIFNAEEKGGLAKPAVFVVDRDCRIRFRSADETAMRIPAAAVVDFVAAGMQATPITRRRMGVPHPNEWVRALRNAVRLGIRSPRD